MEHVNATTLADRLGVSRGRVSQWVSEGKLDGCFNGTGRARRFDVLKVKAALGVNLDAGQLMGNGASTRRAISEAGEATAPQVKESRDGAALHPRDPDRYELARTQKAEEEARRLRRQNAEAEGQFVLAAEAAQEARRLMMQEIAEFETVLRDGARAIADRLGVDFKTARQILVETWRGHRADRAAALSSAAGAAEMTPTELAEDI